MFESITTPLKIEARDLARSFASDCLRWSDETPNASHRNLMQEIARSWIAVAAKIDRHVGDGGELALPDLRNKLN